jgi:hypothetical protein
VRTAPGGQVAENALTVLLYFGANPMQQSPQLFAAAGRVYELPADARDRHLDPLAIPSLC